MLLQVALTRQSILRRLSAKSAHLIEKEIVCMFSFARRVSLGMFLLCTLTSCFAAGPAIGLAIAEGSFQVDRSTVSGNATLFDGNVIETSMASSQLQLNNGVSMRLAAESRARVYRSHLVLERGIGQLESVNYRIDADHVRVTADRRGATARVQVVGPNRVIVCTAEQVSGTNHAVLTSCPSLLVPLEVDRVVALVPHHRGVGLQHHLARVIGADIPGDDMRRRTVR